MSQLQYSEIREKKIIIYNGEPAEVVESHVARTQQRKPQNQVKLKSLITGKTIAATFHVSESADEAEIIKRDITFLYHNRPARNATQRDAGGGEYWFCDPQDKSKRFKLDGALIGETAKFLKQNGNATAMIWDDGEEPDDAEAMRGNGKIIKVTLPIKMDFKVKEAPPAVRGDTSKGGMKVITLENGATLNAPMFINEGDVIRVNTETGEYVERV
jgi:elongation factor P